MSTEGLQQETSILDYTAVGPGMRLRTCREATDWTIEDVARHLRLKPGIIESIESDDYSNPPQMVFLRGYLRAYAKLLNLPEDEIIASFNALQLQEEVKPAPVLKRTPKTPAISINIIGGIAATALVILGLVIWLATARSTPPQPAKLAETVVPVKEETVKLEAAKVQSTLPPQVEAPSLPTADIGAPSALPPQALPPEAPAVAPPLKHKRSNLDDLENPTAVHANNQKMGPVVDDLSVTDNG